MEVLAGFVLLGAALGVWSPWRKEHDCELEDTWW